MEQDRDTEQRDTDLVDELTACIAARMSQVRLAATGIEDLLASHNVSPLLALDLYEIAIDVDRRLCDAWSLMDSCVIGYGDAVAVELKMAHAEITGEGEGGGDD